MKRHVGEQLDPFQLTSIDGQSIDIPQEGSFVHLQFRRFAGCPICNLHLRSYYQRSEELRAARIVEVAIFHSSLSEMLRFHTTTTVHLIADAERRYYKKFGVSKGFWAVANPLVWGPAIRGLMYKGIHFPKESQSPFGLPADFIIDSSGVILVAHYGKHANDHLSVDDALQAVSSFRVAS